MADGPHSAADAEHFYKTLQHFARTVIDDPAAPWKAIPDVKPEHREIIEKMVSWTPAHRNEMNTYLRKAVSLVGQSRKRRLSLVPPVVEQHGTYFCGQSGWL